MFFGFNMTLTVESADKLLSVQFFSTDSLRLAGTISASRSLPLEVAKFLNTSRAYAEIEDIVQLVVE
jgi:hypothetical protein